MTDAQQIFTAAGGIGMFLLGMELLSHALREAAGSRLRRFLARFTTTPLRGVMTGALATAILQSSSAITVMTVGFVGAGLLNLGQAVGIIFGANIGTTATGWLVSLFGLKLDLASIAMAVLLPASLASLLVGGAIARAGRILAGLALILVGLEFMQESLGSAVSGLLPASLTGSGFLQLLELALAGLVITVLIQSSSAAVALTLVLLQDGVIGVPEGAAMVVGMNVGTTFTALLASVGGSRQMRQTAVANLLFNLITGALALPFILLAPGFLVDLGEKAGPLTALMTFHTGFNLIGTALFLPFTGSFIRVVRRLVPDEEEAQIAEPDRALLKDPDAALMSAHRSAMTIRDRIFAALGSVLSAGGSHQMLQVLSPRVPAALDDLEDYVTEITVSGENALRRKAYSYLLHETDHLRRLFRRSQQTERIARLKEDEVLARPACLLGAIMRRIAAGEEDDGARLERLETLLERRLRSYRRALLQGEFRQRTGIQEVFRHTDSVRWLRRSLHHAARIMYYDAQLRAMLGHAPPREEDTPSDAGKEE